MGVAYRLIVLKARDRNLLFTYRSINYKRMKTLIKIVLLPVPAFQCTFIKRTAYIFILVFLCTFTALHAQYNLHIQVDDVSGKAGTLYVTGSFNNWNPADKNYQLKRVNYFRTEITIHNL